MKNTFAFLLVLFTISTASAYKLPSSAIPDGLGVNIHFTGEPAQDLDMIKAAGFRFIRMDFAWGAIERVKGVYDFAAYDQLLDGLLQRGVRPIFILDYNNSLYEQTRGIQSEECRQAFARFAAAGAKRYAGRGVVWELWNEPNIGFWEPQPSLDAYMALARSALPMVRKADPGSICIAPATSTTDLAFLEGCFKQGLLKMIDAISIHPYRQSNPESVEGEIRKLRALVVRYAPDHPDMPIISGEWGYSTGWATFTDEIQGRYLPRELLINLSLGIPLSIWYDWHDDGPDPREPEHRFGTVTQDYKPKLSYIAMERLTKALSGMHFVKRMKSGAKDYILLFSDGKRHTLAAWTTGDRHPMKLLPGEVITVTGDPQYLPIPTGAKALLAEASWSANMRSTAVMAGVARSDKSAPMFTVTVTNPFLAEVPVKLSASPSAGIEGAFTGATSFRLKPAESRTVRWNGQVTRYDMNANTVLVRTEINGLKSTQEIEFNPANPLKVGMSLLPDGRPAVSVTIPDSGTFAGEIRVMGQPDKSDARYQVTMSANRTRIKAQWLFPGGMRTVTPILTGNLALFPFPTAKGPSSSYRVTFSSGKAMLADSSRIAMSELAVTSDTAYAAADGDATVPSTVSLSSVLTDIPIAREARALKLDYEFGSGWKFARIAPKQPLPVSGKPRTMGVWVRGDGSGLALRMRFTDANGRTFQPDFGSADSKTWKLMTARLDDASIANWGGTGPSDRIAYPIKIDSYILVDSKRAPVKGSMEFAGFQLTY